MSFHEILLLEELERVRDSLGYSQRNVEVLKQCKVTTFFPRGNEQYSPLLVIFKTDYEIGIVKGLKTLNWTIFLYKTNNTMILRDGTPGRFQKFEEMGLISDLHISSPLKSYRAP